MMRDFEVLKYRLDDRGYQLFPKSQSYVWTNLAEVAVPFKIHYITCFDISKWIFQNTILKPHCYIPWTDNLYCI